MGNFVSSASTGKIVSTLINEESGSEIMEDVSDLRDNDESVEEQFHDTVSENEESIKEGDIHRNRGEEMNEFRRQLDIKREQRRVILDRHRSEKKKLENRLSDEQKSQIDLCENNKLLRELLLINNIDIPDDIGCARENSYIASSISEMKVEIERLKSNNNTLRCDLAKSNNALQEAYSDIADLSGQNTESIKQVKALKEVITVSKTMINLREEQLNELKTKLSEIEQSLADRETSVLSTDLRKEYERQLQNIRTLRGLYEERARLAEVTRQALVRELDEHKILLQAEINKSKDLNVKVEELETKVNSLGETVEDKNNLIATCQEEARGIKAEMLAVNKLFSQVLLGYKNKQDLDKLIYRLEENHGILTHMAGKENSSEVSSELPKLLLEIVSQIDENEIKSSASENAGLTDVYPTFNTTPEEIVQNLPRVWRVLAELLSHQSEADINTCEKVTTCYKSVETKSGPVLVPSVSQTYIRLKDLIVEKLALIKEVNRMKQLNTHLESRLGEQEKRLCLVTNELSKTWHVVGRLRRHHHQLHTHEKILKYELQQKRKLLNGLKEELEYCREKWEQAREKNTQSEKDWRKLRTEFSNRKLKPELQSLNNSAESGYSDERPSDESSENDESEYVEPKVKCKKKFKKSFETIVDSSADFNLAAEREDPASDMLDVADLPLDTQDDNLECDVSGSCNSDNLCKEKICEETEDEVADLVNDSCLEETVIACEDATDGNIIFVENFNNDVRFNNENIDLSEPSTSVDVTLELAKSKIIDKTEKRLQEIFQDSGIGLNSSQVEFNDNDQVDSAIDTNESQNDDSTTIIEAEVKTELQDNYNDNALSKTLKCADGQNQSEIMEEKNVTNLPSSSSSEGLTVSNQIDFKAILENIKTQNDRLELKDKRLENLEQGCSSVLENISKTLTVGDHIIAKLDTLHADSNKAPSEVSLDLRSEENQSKSYHSPDSDSDSKSSINTEEPSSSREVDHEARFAARDIRLKRLEEQTKSLVKKVNRTTTKGVKIHYKLEELHNIYGSEHSRSGTPSEDTEDISQNEENDENEKE